MRNFSSDTASEPEAWPHRPVTDGNPVAWITLLLNSGPNLISGLRFLKIRIPPAFIWGTEALNFEGFVTTENSEVVMSRTNRAALGPGHSFRISVSKSFHVLYGL